MSTPSFVQRLIGRTIEWELSGVGRGTIESGEAVMYIPPGTSNEVALEQLRQKRPKLRIRPRYCRFAPETYTTPRVFVLVEQDTKRIRPIHYIYAPNAHELQPVG